MPLNFPFEFPPQFRENNFLFPISTSVPVQTQSETGLQARESVASRRRRSHPEGNGG